MAVLYSELMASAIRAEYEKLSVFQDVKAVIEVLQGAGFEALLAGGCVRDGLLGRAVADFDVATNARPDEIESLFKKVVGVGKAFGVMLVVMPQVTVEVATFREDGPYLDGRRPESVSFSSVENDAKRRDFTVNALFYDLRSDQVIDLVGGQEDLSARRIRTVGDPQARFNEDRLRILRAVRFSAQLDFTIEQGTWLAALGMAPEIGLVSMERISQELRKLSQSQGWSRGWMMLESAGLLKVILPALQSAIGENPSGWQRFLLAKRHFKNGMSLSTALASLAFLLGVNSADLEDWGRGLKLSRDEIVTMVRFQKGLGVLLSEKSGLAQRLRIFGLPEGAWLLKWWDYLVGGQNALLQQTLVRYQEIMSRTGELPSPWLAGEDLKRRGWAPGKEMGQALEVIYDAQLEGRINSRQQAESLADNLKNGRKA